MMQSSCACVRACLWVSASFPARAQLAFSTFGPLIEQNQALTAA